MKHADQPGRMATGAVLAALVLAGAALAQTGQISRVEHPGVQARMDLMTGANTALTTLTDMMGGRALFDRDRARAARSRLLSATRAIPSAFRKPHADPLSNADPLVWAQWDDFTTRAKAARRAARALDANTLPRLRLSLPRMIQACLSCHRTYRKPLR